MKRLWMISLALALLLCTACAKQAETTEPIQTHPPQAAQENTQEFTTQQTQDGVRYQGGGVAITMEDGFSLASTSDDSICYENGVLQLIISATNDNDAQMLAQYGYEMESLSEEEYGSILIDTNQLEEDSMFYDSQGNLCLVYTTDATDGNSYSVYSVVRKNPADNRFWLFQFVGAPSVIEAYSLFIPQWAASVEFL